MINLMQGDCLEHMKEIPDGSVDMVLTSPPYNIGKEYETKKSQERYIEEQAACAAEAVRLLKPTGSICWQVGNHINSGEVFPLDVLLYPIFKNHGLQLRNRIVWTFGHGLHCQKRFSGRHETILWFTRTDGYTFNLDSVRIPSKYPNKKHFKGPKKGQLSGNPLGKNPSDVWDIPNVKHNHPEKTAHPCQFPEALCSRMILAASNEGDTVLDPFMGSGTTGVACVNTGRHFIGIELDPDYFNIAKERIGNAGYNDEEPESKTVLDTFFQKE